MYLAMGNSIKQEFFHIWDITMEFSDIPAQMPDGFIHQGDTAVFFPFPSILI